MKDSDKEHIVYTYDSGLVNAAGTSLTKTWVSDNTISAPWVDCMFEAKPVKDVIFNEFSSLTSKQRERLIDALEDHEIMRNFESKITQYWSPVYPGPDKTILSHVTLDELKQIHAQLLIEEHIQEHT